MPGVAAAIVITSLAAPLAVRAEAPADPKFEVTTAVVLKGEPENENFATKNQAMNVWTQNASSEMLVALVSRLGDVDRRADDREYAVAWESDGKTLREVHRVEMTCPDVDLVVPNRGPYAYEVRLDMNPWMLHPECSCPAGSVCPPGVQVNTTPATGATTTSSLSSVVDSHFVSLQNEWEERIGDLALLGRLPNEISAPVEPAGPTPKKASSTATDKPNLACPASRDEPIGSHDVTFAQLAEKDIRLHSNFTGKWCLVRRGVCDETAKVKICEASGAIGTIVVDHGYVAFDQTIIVRMNRQAKERATKPVLFISQAEGEEIFSKLAANAVVTVTVGPSIGAPVIDRYQRGSGIIVHAMNPASYPDGARRVSYPDIFGTVGWAEVSRLRDILFVCLPREGNQGEIRLYNVSDPFHSMTLLSTIASKCSASSNHDYRVLEYLDQAQRVNTVLVDPNDFGNRLYYFDTTDPKNPRMLYELHADWEAANDGLGQVRPGGEAGRFHFVTWHCSNLYCDKNHGDAVYVLDSWNLQKKPIKVELPMMTRGSFARDVACGDDSSGVCLVTLTWDGFVAIDPGPGVNKFRAIASYTSGEFRDDSIPLGRTYLKIHSGAQKVYASRTFPRSFYVEHSEFSLRAMNVGDSLGARSLRELQLVQLLDYDESKELPGALVYEDEGGRGRGGKGGRRRRGGRGGRAMWDGATSTLVVTLVVLLACCAAIVAALAYALFRRKKSVSNPDLSLQPPRSPTEAWNVVVGRPIQAGNEGTGAVTGQPAGSTVCETSGMKTRRDSLAGLVCTE